MWAAALGCSYLVGAIPTAYLAAKWLTNTDIRTVGSGNVGATNLARAAGTKAGIVVFVLDAAKGAVAAWLIASWLLEAPTLAVRLACGLAAVMGHDFPVFLRFRGGKGVATTIGVLVSTVPAVAGVIGLVWVACFALWRYVSVGSLAAAAALPVTQIVMHHDLPEVLLGAVLGLLIIIRHQSNIQRLVQGREHRFSRSK